MTATAVEHLYEVELTFTGSATLQVTANETRSMASLSLAGIIVQNLPVADLNFDGSINFEDFGELSLQWMQNESSADIYPPPCGDAIVDFRDLAVLTDHWLALPAISAHWKLDEAPGGITYDTPGDLNGQPPVT